MIAIVERPSGFAIGGGFDVFEPEIAYDRFVRLIRDLAAFGAWSQKALARFARRRWREMCGEEHESIPFEVRDVIGARQNEGAQRRSTVDQEAHALDLIRAGASDAAAAKASGVTRHRARMLRAEHRLTRRMPHAEYLRIVTLHEQFTALRASGMSRPKALAVLGVTAKNSPERWRMRIARYEAC